MYDEKAALDLKERVKDTGVKVMSGMDGLTEIASMDGFDTLVTAFVGMIGIRPTIAGIKAGKNIALGTQCNLSVSSGISEKEPEQDMAYMFRWAFPRKDKG